MKVILLSMIKGDFYEKHLDCFKNSKNRVVTTVYYLNENWQENDGGELIVYNEDDKFLAKVAPKSNTLIVFRDNIYQHRFAMKSLRFIIAMLKVIFTMTKT